MMRFSRRLTTVSVVVVVACAAMVGCGSSGNSTQGDAGATSQDDASSTGSIVTKYEVVSALEPLTKAVVAYTDSDYGTDPSSPAVLAKVNDNFAAIESREAEWLDFTATIDYGSSDIEGLESAIAKYNAGLDSWQATQQRGLDYWAECQETGGGSTAVAACLMGSYTAADEQEALEQYSSGVKQLLGVLGVTL